MSDISPYVQHYRKYHDDHPKLFPGYSLKMGVDDIAALVAKTSPSSMLDYGSGKGYQYLSKRMHERWGGLLPYCYDPGVSHLSERPDRKFDAVISTDVMEHIPECDVVAVLDDLFSFVAPGEPRFVYLTICCRRSRKTMPNGDPMHMTVMPPEWWDQKLNKYRRDGLIIKVRYENKNIEARLGGG